MSFAIIQAGSSLQFLDEDGDLTTLTLPTGVELSVLTPPRWAVINRYVVLVNTPNTPLTIDGEGTVRPLSPAAPVLAPNVAIGSAGSLSGTYSGIRYTYIVKDSAGNLIAESGMSPESGSVTVTSDKIAVSSIGISSDSEVTGRRIYRGTTNGTTLFKWFDLDGNTLTSFEDDLADADLPIIAAPTLGSAPRLTLIKEWRNRLWGVSEDKKDSLRYAEPDAWWAWPTTNEIKVPVLGDSARGIIGLIPRREALGVGKRDVIWQVTGQTPTDFRIVKLAESTGVESQETMAIYRDTAWWLWKDGVYQWNSEGIKNISDGKVRSWFATDNYFNRDMFDSAFAIFDPTRLKYRLFLAAAESTEIDRWVEYDIETKTWWGPHKTGAFSPTCSFLLFDASDKVVPVTGSEEAYVWQPTTTATDHLATGIELDAITKWHDGEAPDFEKHWGAPSIVGKVQEAGTLTVEPAVGYLNAAYQDPMSNDMTLGRESLDRLGRGQFMRLRLTHSIYNEPVELYGIQIPFNIFGQR
jgi:hypothetical protein